MISFDNISKTKSIMALISCLMLGILCTSGCEKASATSRPSETKSLKNAADRKRFAIDVTLVVRSDLTTEIELVGSLIPIRKTTVVAEIDACVAEIAPCGRTIQVCGVETPLAIDIGSRVKKGQVLVRLKDRDQQLALNIAKANQAQLESELRNLLSWRRAEEIAQLEADVEETKARAICAKADRERYSRLIEKKAISQSDYDNIIAEEVQACAAVKKTEAALSIARTGPTKEEVEVAKAHLLVTQAKVALRADTLEKTIIRAPYDGIVTKRYVEVGDRLIEMMDPDILDIVDSRILFAEVPVPERYQMGVKIGQTAKITVAGLAEPIVGQVDQIDGNIDPQTRTFLIRVTIDNAKETLKPGGFTRVYLPVASAQSTLTVPFSAVSFDSGQPSVFVYQDGHVVRKSVKLGLSNREKHEVISGVSEGDLVASGQIAVLSDGLQVVVRKENKNRPTGTQ